MPCPAVLMILTVDRRAALAAALLVVEQIRAPGLTLQP